MQNLLLIFTMLFSSGYALLLDHLAYTSRDIQKALVLPIIILMILVYFSPISTWNAYIKRHGRWFFLFWGTVLLQTLVVATGAFQSPFLVLIHLFMIALSFLFSFSIAVIFLLLSLIVIFLDVSAMHNLIIFFQKDLSTIILQMVSFVTIIPLAYIVSQQYHIKEAISNALRTKITTDEAILERVNELIIVTDTNLRILSVNDAVERTLQKSRSELIDKPFFDMLLLKDVQGALVKESSLFPQGTESIPKKIQDPFTLINTPLEYKKVTLQISTIKNQEANIHQFSFILSFVHEPASQESNLQVTIEKARAKYEAMAVSLKNNLSPGNVSQSHMQLLWLEKLESDIYTTTTLNYDQGKDAQTRFDLAKLCQQLVILEKPFANSYTIPLTFELKNFGQKDIEPLTVKNYPVSPEQLTGPFFTVPNDVKKTELIIKKLLDIGIYLSSTISDEPWVKVQVALKRRTAVLVTISARIPQLEESELSDIFVPGYGNLANKTNLLTGSGLEGFLARTISEQLENPIETKLIKNPKTHITFSFTLKKSPEAM